MRATIKLYILTFIVLAFFLFVSFKTKIPIAIFIKDPAVIAGSNALIGSNVNATINPLIGAVSNIGILLWCISATLCFFSFFILNEHRKILNNTQLNQLSYFLFYSGILTVALLLDDLFLFHEAIAPKLLNLSQTFIYICLAIVTLFWISFFRRIIFRTEWFFLFFAFIFFGLSIGLDRIMDWSIYPSYLVGLSKDHLAIVEDGAKLFGIVNWFRYFAKLSLDSIKLIIK